ncbi:unnamed protein product, partial [Sphacelaria rigidula]
VWALDCLLEPVATRFRFHFEEERPTNRTDSEFWGTLRHTRLYVSTAIRLLAHRCCP